MPVQPVEFVKLVLFPVVELFIVSVCEVGEVTEVEFSIEGVTEEDTPLVLPTIELDVTSDEEKFGLFIATVVVEATAPAFGKESEGRNAIETARVTIITPAARPAIRIPFLRPLIACYAFSIASIITLIRIYTFVFSFI